MNLTNNKIKNTYGGVLNVGATGFNGNILYNVTDGFGNPTPLNLSETGVNVLGTFSVNGVVFDPESGYHGSFYSTATQSNSGITATNKVSYNGTFTNNNVIFQNNTEVKFLEKATYDIQFSLQFEKSGGGDSTVQIWFQKNGINISDSNTEITIHSNNRKFVAAWDIMLNLNANDIIEICWHSNDISVKLVPHPAQTNPDRPAIPSVIFSALQVTNILTGAPGATGPVGAPGPTGPAGATGQSIIGATGAQGYQGFQGLKGDVGSNGAVGAQGYQGFQGLKGDAGSNGAVGANGAQGFQGRQGFQGVQGRQGFQGLTGPDGAPGADAGLSLRYRIQSVSAFVVPNTGRVTTDNDTVSTITEIVFNYEDFYTVDAKSYWNQLVTWLSIPTNKASLIITTIESPSTKGIFPITSINSNSTLQFFNIVLDAPIYSNGTLSVGQTLVSSWIGEAIGLPGPTGPDGLQGPIGIGVQGVQGPAGTGGGGTGSGTQGFQGVQGLAGSNGNQGVQGFQGRQGLAGLTGTNGSNGNQGFQGLAGANGSNGNQGFQGLAGTNGSNGNQGFQGLAGTNGSNGNQGFQGFQGFQGIKGDIGSTGPAGGPQGPQGFQGLQPISSLITLTDAATISWTYSTGQTAKVNINGNRALTITGATNGDYGTLILTHGITNSIITSFPTTSVFVDGTYSFSSNAGTIDIFSFVLDTGTYYWVYNKNFV